MSRRCPLFIGMKYKYYLMPLLCMFMMAACSSDETENIITPPDEKPEMYTVSFDFSGDIDVSQEPLSRGTATDDVYGFNVYYNADKSESIDDIYAYGLFDNKEDMTIALLSGYKYKFECTLVKNGKKTLYYGQAFNNAYTGVCYPFQTNSSNSTMIENKFTIGTSTYLIGIKKGDAHLASVTPNTSNANKYASVNRFYGETDNYAPIQNGEVTIELKRVVFGAKFVITGVQEGSLTASCGSFWSKTTTVDDEGTATIYSYPDVYDCWKNETNLTETVTLTYTSNRGTQWNLSSSTTVTFKRNVMTTVNINVSPDLSSGTFTLTEEPLSEDVNYIDLEINGDGVIDTPVTPSE